MDSGAISLIILLMCTPFGDTMKIKSIEASEAELDWKVRYAIMDRSATCAEKIAQLTKPPVAALIDFPSDEPLPIQCGQVSAVPFLLNDTLFTLACELRDPADDNELE